MRKLAIGLLLILIVAWGTSSREIKKEKSVPADTDVITVYGIENASFYDNQETFRYYWGANFFTNQAPQTKLNCRISALNENGEEILSVQGIYNVLNDGGTIPFDRYQTQNDLMPTTTKAKYKAIKSFDISCTKAAIQ